MLIASMIMMAGCGSNDSDAGEQAAEQEQNTPFHSSRYQIVDQHRQKSEQ